MTLPCENKDDIKTLHTKVDNLTDSFNSFRLNASVDIATLKAENKTDSKNEGKKSGGRSGGIVSAVVIIIYTLVDMMSK